MPSLFLFWLSFFISILFIPATIRAQDSAPQQRDWQDTTIANYHLYSWPEMTLKNWNTLIDKAEHHLEEGVYFGLDSTVIFAGYHNGLPKNVNIEYFKIDALRKQLGWSKVILDTTVCYSSGEPIVQGAFYDSYAHFDTVSYINLKGFDNCTFTIPFYTLRFHNDEGFSYNNCTFEEDFTVNSNTRITFNGCTFKKRLILNNTVYSFPLIVTGGSINSIYVVNNHLPKLLLYSVSVSKINVTASNLTHFTLNNSTSLRSFVLKGLGNARNILIVGTGNLEDLSILLDDIVTDSLTVSNCASSSFKLQNSNVKDLLSYVNFRSSYFEVTDCVIDSLPNYYKTSIIGTGVLEEDNYKSGIDLTGLNIIGRLSIKMTKTPSKLTETAFSISDLLHNKILFLRAKNVSYEELSDRITQIYSRYYEELVLAGNRGKAEKLRNVAEGINVDLVGQWYHDIIYWLFPLGSPPIPYIVILLCSWLMFGMIYYHGLNKHTISSTDIMTQDKINAGPILVALYFSTIVLISIKPKKNWLTLAPSFVRITITQYVIGVILIALFLIFAAKDIPYFSFIREWFFIR